MQGLNVRLVLPLSAVSHAHAHARFAHTNIATTNAFRQDAALSRPKMDPFTQHWARNEEQLISLHLIPSTPFYTQHPRSYKATHVLSLGVFYKSCLYQRILLSWSMTLRAVSTFGLTLGMQDVCIVCLCELNHLSNIKHTTSFIRQLPVKKQYICGGGCSGDSYSQTQMPPYLLGV